MPERTKLEELEKRAAFIQHQQAHADALFASIGDGAVATDEQGKVSRINKAALRLLGFKREEIVGQWFPKVIVAQDEEGNPIKTINRPITRAFLSGKAITQKMHYVCKDGTRLPVSITVSPIMLDDRPIGAIEVFRDISREQEVDRMKTEFIYLASHQLRTPLTAVKTYAHMLSEGYRGELTRDQAEFMRIILASLDRMNEIISTLLNISRIEAGKMTVTPSVVRMGELLEQVIEELTPTIENKSLRIKKLFDDVLPIVTDPMLAKEICVNLLSNAIKYTPSGGVVTVMLRQKDDMQVASVKDTGYGIPREAQAKLFTKFFRAPNVLEKEEGGTGLGLYLVKGIAEVLGAKVWFKSTEGKGSTFYFGVPCKDIEGKRD